jgi:hypothetical protein
MTFSNVATSFVGAVGNNNRTGNGVSYVKHIRTPSVSDVLSGRGGSVNQHPGNIQFRKWVNELKHEYNLAPSKIEKAQICRTVIDKVLNQHPPGKFLAREETYVNGGLSAATTVTSSSSNWWIELDDERVMAKTSQALREGAPKIREEHQDEVVAAHKKEQNKWKQQLVGAITATRKKTATTASTAPTNSTSPTRARPVRSVAVTPVTTATTFTTASTSGTSGNKRKLNDVASVSASYSTAPTVALLPSLPTFSVPPPFTSKLHLRSTRKGPIYNSTPYSTPATTNSSNNDINNNNFTMNHPMATAKHVRVEYKGMPVNPSDASPIFIPLASASYTTGSNSDRHNSPIDINHLLYSSSTATTTGISSSPITTQALNRFDYVNSSNSSMEGQEQQQGLSSAIIYQGGISRFDKSSLKRSHSLALSDIEGWSTSNDFVNPFEHEEEKFLSIEKQTSVSSTDSNNNNNNNILSTPPLPTPHVGILRETSTSSNGDLGGIGALLCPNSIRGSSNYTISSATLPITSEGILTARSDILPSTSANVTSSKSCIDSIDPVDDGWYERTASLTSTTSLNQQYQQLQNDHTNQNSTSADNLSKWLMFGDDFDSSSNVTAIGSDWNDDAESIFVPVSP